MPPAYLDHNATTPVDPRVLQAMLPSFTDVFGNPSSLDHRHGQAALAAAEEARRKVAASLGARESEIVFTGSCTESNNLAIVGAARAQRGRRHLITSAIEHPSVLEPMRSLEAEGYEVTFLGVDEQGRVDPGAAAAAIRDDTLLVSVMAANNEVGTIQPIAEIGAACEARGVLFHVDLAQRMAHGPFDVEANHVHLASVSGHKAYGPKGIGALYIRSTNGGVPIVPLTLGGGQEKGLRSGTLNVAFAVALGEALAIAAAEGEQEASRLRTFSAKFVAALLKSLDGVQVNGHPTERIPGNVSVSIAGVEPLALMHRLRDVASFSASSACATGHARTSYVLRAMFGDTERARTAFRLSPGRFTTEKEMADFADALIEAVGALRGYTA